MAEPPATATPAGRAASNGEGWAEVFLSVSEGQICEPWQSVARGHSILVLRDLATPTECEQLRAEASSAAAAERDDVKGKFACDRPERIRLPVLERLGDEGLALYDALLLRACARAKECLPALVSGLFGEDTLNGSTCLHNDQLMFSLGEPAINVYQSGGCFKAHQDKQSLTVLMPLTSSDAFEGGGTAFWSADQPLPEYGGSGADGFLKGPAPALELVPAAGAALLFGGSVTHAGLSVSSGERVCFVCSFSPSSGRDLGRAADGGVVRPVEEETVWRAGEEVDSCLPVGDSTGPIILSF